MINLGDKSQHYSKWIPATIETLRESAGLSQLELAKKIGFSSASSISHFEKGERLPTIDILDKIFTTCGATLTIGYEAKPASQIETKFAYVRKDALRAIVKAVHDIDPDILDNY